MIPPTKPTRELISFAVTLHEDEPNTTFISRGKPNQKNEPHKDKKSTKQETRKKGVRKIEQTQLFFIDQWGEGRVPHLISLIKWLLKPDSANTCFLGIALHTHRAA
jgi:hypothetical protein